MTYDQIIKHYGTQAKAARAIGVVTQMLVGWNNRNTVPLDKQCLYEVDSAGRLKADLPKGLRKIIRGPARAVPTPQPQANPLSA